MIASYTTSRIPGITGAGASPELTDYTPAADAELIVHGEPRCLPEIPQTLVDGQAAPTPAVITKASLELSKIPFLIADAGAAIKPNVPYININHKEGDKAFLQETRLKILKKYIIKVKSWVKLYRNLPVI